MNFLDAIHQGDLTAVRKQLAGRPELLNRADAQGNTPLHYAVASHHLALIEYLIFQGADVSVKNQQGETAAQWYEEIIVSLHSFRQLISSKELRLVIEVNDVQFMKDEVIVKSHSCGLRFAHGKTMLHCAVELQKPAIVQLILEGIPQENINRLLNLQDSRGRTPIALAEQFYHYGTPTAREIFHSLQEKQQATIPEEINSSGEPLPLGEWPLAMNQEFMNRIKQLSARLKQPITPADFESLNPMREVICQLAYVTCRQALTRLLTPERQDLSEKTLLHSLFGSWCGHIRLEFQKKLQTVADYLAELIQQKKVDEVIYFSDEEICSRGWIDVSENKIYLNPTQKYAKNTIYLVTTLIHEITHKVVKSYDFAVMGCFIDSQGYSIDLDISFQLASTGLDEKSTPVHVQLFELRQLLQEGASPDWREHLNHWMALNNADTQTLAILVLAALPEGHAKYQRKQNTLLIKKHFLSTAYLKKYPTPPPLLTTYRSPVTEPSMGIALPSSDVPPGPSRTEPTRRSLGKSWFSWCHNPEEESAAIAVQSELSRSGSANYSFKTRLVNRFKAKQKGERVTGSPSPSSDQDEGMCDSLSRILSPPTQLSQAMASTSFSTPSNLPLAVSSPPQRLSFVGYIRDNDSDDTE